MFGNRGIIPFMTLLGIAWLSQPLPLLHSVAMAGAETVLTDDLNGLSITYTYSGGRSYRVQFAEGGLSYRYLPGAKPEKWWGPFPYRAMLTDKGEYLVAWFEEGYGDCITLLFDLETKALYGSGVLARKATHFQRVEISAVARAASDG